MSKKRMPARDYSLGAIGADHPVFDIITWTTGQQRSRSRLGCSRPVLRVNIREGAEARFARSHFGR